MHNSDSSNPFINIQAHMLPAKGTAVEWKLNPEFTGKAPYSFRLQAFQDVGFKEPIFDKDVGETFYAIDDTNLRQNVLASYCYRVILTTSDDKEYISPWCNWSPEGTNKHKWLLANEITRKSWVGLWRWGLYGYLLKRKVYAPTALNEVDPVTGEPVIDTSKGSVGVGMVGGYHAPVLTKYWLLGQKQQMDFQQDGRGATYREDVKIWTVGFPFFDSHDILVNEEYKRFMITEVNNTFFPGTLVSLKQEMAMQIIPPTDTVYSIPVPDFPKYD